ncbi:MAG: alpha-N-arabinofuranosidase [Prevotella sp.]|nr:alpha-N-arabinofuranosidase [Prevotella sp.]
MYKSILFSLALLCSSQAFADVPVKKNISKDLFGIFIEDLNYTADGGLYAEMVQNRSFEYSPSDIDLRVYYKKGQWHPFTAWEFLKDGNAIGKFSLETARPLNVNNRHYATIQVLTVGSKGAGIRNLGYEGMVVRKGDRYDFSVFMRNEDVAAMPVQVRLMQKDNVLAEGTFTTDSKDWKKYELSLTALGNADDATLDIRMMEQGTASMDMISLFPQKTFKGRKNGLRSDLAQLLADLQPSFVRFPGGCLTHGDGLGNIYRWKNTIGPVEQRIEDYDIWDYHQTFGLGFFEYFQLCEDIGAKALPVLAAGVSCQNSARCRGNGQQAIPMEEMPQYVQDMLDLIEYANGPVTSTWGAKRAAAGHPEPFNLEYIGIGNEDHITPEFAVRFKMINDAIKAKYPKIKVVGTAGPDPNGRDWENGWRVADSTRVDIVDEHYYRAPQWFLDNLHRYDSYARTKSKVYVGEYASRGNRLINAIAEAAYLTQLERNGDVVSLASYAPLLARIGNTQWNPDLIYFDKTQVYPTINYYVQQLFGQNDGDIYWSNIVKGAETVSCVQDSKTGDVILKLVNATENKVPVSADLSSFRRLEKRATISVLTGNKDVENGKGQFLDTDLRPVTSIMKVGRSVNYDMPAYSLTVIRLHAR